MIGRIKKHLQNFTSVSRSEQPSLLHQFQASRNPMDAHRICHAPFKSIRFEPRGIVRTCCYNVEVVLGRYPDMSLNEIWNSEEANRLREKISHSDLSMGCRLCEKQLQNKEFDTVKLLQYDGMQESEGGYPVVLDFSLHNTCNLECTMCHGEYSSSIRKNREKLPPVPMLYDHGFTAQLNEFIPHAKQFVFAGGEPFLIQIHYDIWESINRLNPNSEVDIVTNGTILNERVKSILNGGNYHLTMSIDSFHKETYESIRLNASYDKVMENMRYFQNYCQMRGTRFCLNVCPVAENRFEIPAIVSHCNKNSINLYLLNVIYPPSASLQSLDRDELHHLLSEYAKHDLPMNTEIEQHNARQFADLQNRLRSWCEEKDRGPESSLRIEDSEDFEVLTAFLLQKAKAFCQDNNDANEGEVIAKIDRLNAHFKSSRVPKGRIKEMQSISPERVYSMLVGLSESDLKMVVKNQCRPKRFLRRVFRTDLLG